MIWTTLAFAALLFSAVPQAYSAPLKLQNRTVPLAAPSDGVYRLLGDYLNTKWRYSGFQLYSPTMNKWRFDWVFEQTPFVYTPSQLQEKSSEVFETGITGGGLDNPYINAYLVLPGSGETWCWHIPMQSFWANDYLTTATEVAPYSEWQDSVLADYVVPLTGSTYRLKQGYWDGKVVKLYNNTDTWLTCQTSDVAGLGCGIVTAVGIKTNTMLRQFYVQPSNSFYSDFYDFKPVDASDPLWKRSFDIPTSWQNVTCYGPPGTTGKYNNAGMQNS